MNKPTSQRLLFRWIGWFFLISSIILFLIQLSFLKYMPKLHLIHGATSGNIILAHIFLIASYITQVSLIFFACALITLLLTAFLPKRPIIFCLGIFLTSVFIFLQIIDAVTYGLYQSHEIALSLDILKSGTIQQVLPMSLSEVSLIFIIAFSVLFIQTLIALWVWRRVKRDKPTTGHSSIWISTFIVACFCFSYGMMAGVLSLPKRFQINDVTGLLLLKTARLVPYYSSLFEFIMPLENPYGRTIKTKNGWLTYQTRQPIRKMHYPIHPLKFNLKKPQFNVLFLVIDTWRFDAFNKIITPNLARFAKKTLQFQDHWSGGNCTQTGIFTLFYGIPSNYWDATIANKEAPIFFKTLQKERYQIAIYTSATLKFPSFNKNVFVDIHPLRTKTKGLTTVDRDKKITLEFNQFLKTRNKKRPFFGFVFYDAAHNYCDGGKTGLQKPFQPAIRECVRFSLTKNTNPAPYINRYHNALYFIDQQIQKILQALKKEGLYKNTIIFITSDHGEQFNDEKLGYWSHNSAYSSYQLHVPLLIYWPGKKPRTISYLSTHFDIIPTLMQNALHCLNPTYDYSTGHTLFALDREQYMLCASYTNYAVLLRKRHTTFYSNGAYAIRASKNQLLPYAVLNAKNIKEANIDLNRFFKN